MTMQCLPNARRYDMMLQSSTTYLCASSASLSRSSDSCTSKRFACGKSCADNSRPTGMPVVFSAAR